MKYKPKRRSLLFFPASNTRYYQKALESDADSIVFDLEDSIPDSHKKYARDVLLGNFPAQYNGPKELIVRINDPKSAFYLDDLEIIKSIKPDAVRVPKVEKAREILELANYLESHENSRIKPMEILVSIETTRGYRSAQEILSSSDRVTSASLGVEDLIAETGLERKRLSDMPLIANMLENLALYCHQFGIQHIGPITRGYTTNEHMQQLEDDCKYLQSLNAKGKIAIHPNQITIINKYFNIPKEQIDQAELTLQLFSQSADKGSSVVVNNGEMEDQPSLKKAQAIIKYARKHGFID